MTDHQPPPAVERLDQYLSGPSPYIAYRGAPPPGTPTLAGDLRAVLLDHAAQAESLRHSVEREAAAWAFVERTAKRDENKSNPGVYANERQEGFSDGYNEANEEVATEARAALDRRAGT